MSSRVRSQPLVPSRAHGPGHVPRPCTCLDGRSLAAADSTRAPSRQALTDLTTGIRLLLYGDTWSASLGALNSTGYADLVASFFTDQPTTLLTGWRVFVTPQLSPEDHPGAVVRTSPTVVSLTVPPTPAYSLNTPETITVSIPGSATTSERSYYAATSFAVQATADAVEISGTRLDEDILRGAGEKVVELTLISGKGRYWNTGLLVPDHEGRTQLLSDIVSLQDEERGWNAMIGPYLTPEAAIRLESDAADGRTDGKHMRLSLLLGQFDGYNIT